MERRAFAGAASGDDDLIGCLFDGVVSRRARRWIGELIFADEAQALQRFIDSFVPFPDEWQAQDRHLRRLHEARLPDHVVNSAKALAGVVLWVPGPRYRGAVAGSELLPHPPGRRGGAEDAADAAGPDRGPFRHRPPRARRLSRQPPRLSARRAKWASIARRMPSAICAWPSGEWM